MSVQTYLQEFLYLQILCNVPFKQLITSEVVVFSGVALLYFQNYC